MKLPIKPFDEYFSNCYVNAIISILDYYDESYRLAVYENNYVPHFSDYRDLYFPYVGFKENIDDIVADSIVFEARFYEDINNCIDVVKDCIKSGNYVFVALDLFYWDKTGTIRNREHIYHPSLIIGFDDEKRIVYALEDQLTMRLNYSVMEYSYEEFFNAVSTRDMPENNYLPFDYKVCKVNKNLKPYQLSVKKLKTNANEIITALKDERFVQFSLFGDDLKEARMMDEYIRCQTRYSQRAHANGLLFNELEKMEVISKKLQSELIAHCNNIEKAIETSKLYMHKKSIRKQPVDIEMVENKWRNAFQEEVEMWTAFLRQV